jgi:hypothetical protein
MWYRLHRISIGLVTLNVLLIHDISQVCVSVSMCRMTPVRIITSTSIHL